MIKCPECGYEEFDSWWVCPKCGYKIGDEPMKEVLFVECGEEGENPYLHAGRFESYFYDENFRHNLMTSQPWGYGGKKKVQVKITIEELGEG